jgi:hypothetical protein
MEGAMHLRKRTQRFNDCLIFRETQMQLNRRISEIRSRVERLNAELAEHLSNFDKEEDIYITLWLTPVETGWWKLWEMVLFQCVRRTTLTGKKSPEPTTEQTATSDLLSGLTWEHPCEKMCPQSNNLSDGD